MLKTIILGLLFGVILQRSRVNTFDKIAGFAILQDFTVPKVLFTAIGVGSVLLFIQVNLGLATLSLKPLLLTGVILGGFIFGVGMAILGYCPGTLIVALGEGALDAVFGVLGGLLAGWFYIMLYPNLRPFLGPDLGKLSLHSQSAFLSLVIVLLYAALMVALAFYLNRLEKRGRGSGA
jgi:uncharacterized membrane protein YedE/YeeE